MIESVEKALTLGNKPKKIKVSFDLSTFKNMQKLYDKRSELADTRNKLVASKAELTQRLAELGSKTIDAADVEFLLEDGPINDLSRINRAEVKNIQDKLDDLDLQISVLDRASKVLHETKISPLEREAKAHFSKEIDKQLVPLKKKVHQAVSDLIAASDAIYQMSIEARHIGLPGNPYFPGFQPVNLANQRTLAEHYRQNHL